MYADQDVRKAKISGSDELGYAISLDYYVPGNFGERRVASRFLPERFQRVETAEAFLHAAGIQRAKIVRSAAGERRAPIRTQQS